MEPEIPKEIAENLEEEQRKRARNDSDDDSGDVSDAAALAVDGAGWCDWGGVCDGPGDCDVPGCDCLLLVRLSALLGLAALLVPRRDAGLVAALIRFYRRRLTRFTPACPSTPSCSAYALAAVAELGPRRGLATTARRVRECGGRRPAVVARRG